MLQHLEFAYHCVHLGTLDIDETPQTLDLCVFNVDFVF